MIINSFPASSNCHSPTALFHASYAPQVHYLNDRKCSGLLAGGKIQQLLFAFLSLRRLLGSLSLPREQVFQGQDAEGRCQVLLRHVVRRDCD